MTSERDKENLLEEVLGESMPDGFREKILQQTLHSVRRRRRNRRAYKMAGALAAIFAVGFIFHPAGLRPLSAEAVTYGCEIVRTSPFPSGSIISTKPLRGDQLATAIFAVGVVHTQGNGYYYRDLTDDELLALIANRSGLLVHVGPGKKELIFANEADQRGFPLN